MSIRPTLRLLSLFALPGVLSAQERCPFTEPSPGDGVLIGYIGNPRTTSSSGDRVTVGTFRVFGELIDGDLMASDGAVIRTGMSFWRVLDPARSPIELGQVSSFLDRMGPDRCVFHGEPADPVEPFRLLSSEPLPGTFRRPTDAERAELREQNDRAELLAVTDTDGDGEAEYWATAPYTWDTGVTLWRRTSDGLIQQMAVCAGCSD